MASTSVTILLILISAALITVVLLQPGRSAGLSGSISGGAEQLMGKQKARGVEAFLAKTTVVLAVMFFICTILLAYILQ
ncbi:preprotein translocase subunit SecG [Geomicrobium halophilum]|uniref:Protein-export membrane protein SecG n=1 Tax=Geomicrobium halophilum TaxID=549000 RepID=A0A841PN90_9BACL|nr:preprotein translocase subunit SecG [Geomicrobium halophilum]MBB6450317.1 preprotein translocase subunit SecG [Geomicrobium halophilum]